MKNYVYVKHKANSPWPNLSAAWYVWWRLLFKRKARITITVGADISNASTGTNMWLKACGWKSGWHTKSNNETLIAYRIVGPCVEFCRYERRGEKLSFEDEKARGIGRLISVTYEIEKPKGSAMRWPCIPWSEGGGKIPLADYGYFLEIE
jgi:hypothetical protein